MKTICPDDRNRERHKPRSVVGLPRCSRVRSTTSLSRLLRIGQVASAVLRC